MEEAKPVEEAKEEAVPEAAPEVVAEPAPVEEAKVEWNEWWKRKPLQIKMFILNSLLLYKF